MKSQSNVQESVIIEVKELKACLGETWVLNGMNLSVNRGEIFAIVGGSGSGKTTLLNCMLMLLDYQSGEIKLFEKNIKKLSPNQETALRQRWGVMFQSSALFSSLTLLENVAFPLKYNTSLKKNLITEIAMLKIIMAGLPNEAAHKYPSELSGGMQKRAALSRALAMDPELLFLDEPTAGLDPEGANDLDKLILELKKTLGLTVVMVTHDLDTLWGIADRVAFLGNKGEVLEIGTMKQLAQSEHPVIKAYFSGPRGHAANHRHKPQEET